MRMELFKSDGFEVAEQDLGDLAVGDCVVFRTAHSTYHFWVEFPVLGIGVISGGQVGRPTRVRLVADGVETDRLDVPTLRVGGRARVTLLGPLGEPIRCVVTSTIGSLRHLPQRSAAA